MSDTTAARSFELRHLQLARALLAVVAAIMITFSPDHSAGVGLSVFSGFALATALVLLLGAWLVFPRGRRATPATIGSLTAVAGLVASVPAIRTTELFFGLVIVWALATGLVEGIAGLRATRRSPRGSAARSEARDDATVGAFGVVFGLALLLVPAQYALEYYIEDAERSFTLTGIIIGVGLLGAYTAIVGVYLAIAAFSPRRDEPASDVEGTALIDGATGEGNRADPSATEGGRP